MDISKGTKPQWVLVVIKDGQEVEAGRFETDFLALRFAEDYRLTDWRIVPPPRST